MDDFTAIDVETANPDFSSICQIGVAQFVDGAEAREWKSYVDPDDFFDPVNISIHGITDEMVQGAPRFRDLCVELSAALEGRVVVCHTPFDRVAITRAFEKADTAPPACTWLDTARVARRAWEEFAQSGYGLKNVCQSIGYEYEAHDALEDAKAAAEVLLAAVKRTGLAVDGWNPTGRAAHPSTSGRWRVEQPSRKGRQPRWPAMGLTWSSSPARSP